MRVYHSGANDRSANTEHSAVIGEVEDVYIDEASGAGIEVHGSELHAAEVTVRRAVIEGNLGGAVVVTRGRGSLQISDLRVTDVQRLVRLSSDCPPTELAVCSGSGLILAAESEPFTVELDRFIVEDAGFAGIAHGRAVELRARHGLVRRAPHGLAVHDRNSDWRDTLIDVVLEVPVPIVAGQL